MPSLSALTSLVLVVTLLVSVATDLKRRTIYDLLTWPALGLVLGLRVWREGTGDDSTGLLSGLAGLSIAGAWFGIFALRKSLGWGDVKLALVMGGAFGFPRVLVALIFVTLAGAFQAVVSLIWQGKLSDTVRGVLARDGDTSPKKYIPYGVAIALGSLGAMVWDGNAF